MDLYLIRKRVILSQMYSNQFRAILLGWSGGLTAPPIVKKIPAIYFCLLKKEYIHIS